MFKSRRAAREKRQEELAQLDRELRAHAKRALTQLRTKQAIALLHRLGHEDLADILEARCEDGSLQQDASQAGPSPTLVSYSPAAGESRQSA